MGIGAARPAHSEPPLPQARLSRHRAFYVQRAWDRTGMPSQRRPQPRVPSYGQLGMQAGNVRNRTDIQAYFGDATDYGHVTIRRERRNKNQ